jgi:hypothetical protein
MTVLIHFSPTTVQMGASTHDGLGRAACATLKPSHKALFCSIVGNSSKYGIAGVTFANVTLAGRKLSVATAKEDGMEISQARGVVFQ